MIVERRNTGGAVGEVGALIGNHSWVGGVAAAAGLSVNLRIAGAIDSRFHLQPRRALTYGQEDVIGPVSIGGDG